MIWFTSICLLRFIQESGLHNWTINSQYNKVRISKSQPAIWFFFYFSILNFLSADDIARYWEWDENWDGLSHNVTSAILYSTLSTSSIMHSFFQFSWFHLLIVLVLLLTVLDSIKKMSKKKNTWKKLQYFPPYHQHSTFPWLHNWLIKITVDALHQLFTIKTNLYSRNTTHMQE